MEIQIDAGVPGIQLDECELPMTSISSGGCFCKSCMQQFADYLKERKKAGRLGTEWEGIDLDAFHYGEYLKAHNCTYPKGAPFYRDYWEFQVRQVQRYFTELADYARQYAMEKHGRRLLVSGNFYNMQPAYYPVEHKVDIVITEMEHTLFRQPYYYRYCAGFASGKPVIIAENPYGGIVPPLLEMLDRGRGYDLYRIYLLEAAVYGCNMSVPYGSWMGNTIKDAFWAPRSLTAGVQDFLAAHEECYPRTKSRGAAVLYSYGSYYWRDSNKGSGANGMQDAYNTLMDATAAEWLDPDLKPVPFWDILRAMSERNAQYDVVMLPDGDYRVDDFTSEKLEGYPLVIVPDCFVLTENQQQILLGYAQGGGKVLVSGRLAEGTSFTERLKETGNAAFVPLTGNKEQDVLSFMAAFETLYSAFAPVECRAEKIGVQRYDREGNTWIHVLNYRYDKEKDRIMTIEKLELTIRDVAGREPVILVPEGEPVPTYEIFTEIEKIRLILRNAGLYTIIAFA